MTTAPLTRDDLVAAHHGSGRPRDRWLVGAEFERHLLRPDGSPLPYEADAGFPSVRWLLDRLVAGGGWEPVTENGTTIALHGHLVGGPHPRNRGDVTLEPGGQFELSGSPFPTAREVMDEARVFADEVAEILEERGVWQIALGFTPYTAIPDVGSPTT
jgi:glutamate--cysteine ligase